MRTEVTVAAEPRATRGRTQPAHTARGHGPGRALRAYKDAVSISVDPKSIQRKFCAARPGITRFSIST